MNKEEQEFLNYLKELYKYDPKGFKEYLSEY